MTEKWQISGEYFENCNCAVVCPCLVSTKAPLTSQPTDGDCHVAMVFHINHGKYGEVALDGLNVALIAKSDGPMANGNMTGAAYIDERAGDKQTEALGAIFTGTVGGPMAAFAPLFGSNLGMKKARISFDMGERRRSGVVSCVLSMAVHALPSMTESGEIWAATGHPCNPERLAFAVGEDRSTFDDHGMHWDNSGRNGHYAPINWSN
jgi:hypothetical protein